MTTQQLENLLHFFGKDEYVILVRRRLDDGSDRSDYDLLLSRYKDVCIRLNVSKHNNQFRPSEFPRTNQRENAFVVKQRDWEGGTILYDFLFSKSIEERIETKKHRNDLNFKKNDGCSSLDEVKDAIEKYMLSRPRVNVTESILPLLKFINKISLQKKLKSLSYDDFLQTAYWAHTRYEILSKIGYTCQLCGKKTKTPNVHHNTYEHHGREMEYLTDLIVLCPECHKRYHKK